MEQRRSRFQQRLAWSLAFALYLCNTVAADEGDPVRLWIAALNDPYRRLDAAYALDSVAAEGTTALPILMKSLSDPDPFVRRAAAAALGEIEAEPGRRVAPLVEALGDGDSRVTAAAAVSLAKIGPPAVPALMEVLKRGMRPPTTQEQSLILMATESCSGYSIYRPAVSAAVALADIGSPAVASLVSTLRLPPRSELGIDTYLPAMVALRRIRAPAIPERAFIEVSHPDRHPPRADPG
jgi:hypothetical protein